MRNRLIALTTSLALTTTLAVPAMAQKEPVPFDEARRSEQPLRSLAAGI